MSVLKLDNISVSFGPINVLKDVSLEVQPGEIVSLIGSNGAGKTTTLRAISRLAPLRSGSLHLFKNDISNRQAHELITLGVSHVPEGRRIFPRMSVEENLLLGACTIDDPKVIQEQLEFGFELFPILKDRVKQPGGTLSGGEQQMLAIARALMVRPILLLLDEPSMGVAPKIIKKIFETLVALNKAGMTILLVEQNATAALEIAHRGYVLDMGQITLEGSGAELLHNDAVIEAYLGG